MNCPGCNHPLSGNEDFCPVCGIRLIDYYRKENENKKGKNKVILAAAIAVAILSFVILAVAISLFISDGNNSDSDVIEAVSTDVIVDTNSPQTPEVNVAPDPPQKTVHDVEMAINNYIASYTSASEVAVSVYDNNTHFQYNSSMADSQFSAWGFYVPIYIAYRSEYGNDSDAYNILSSDPTKCNAAANSAMDYFGGPTGITNYLSRNFNTTATYYERKFGQSSKGKDNCTSSREAARLMNVLYERYNYANLSYNPASFGISFPSDAVVYSQLGTENLNVKNCLNVFAVVHGNYSNYSIAVLTRDGAGNNGFISGLMAFVHSEMEGIGKNG